jgi:hypothetical protein
MAMDDMGGRRDDIVGTTDYLEAITVFKSAKNFLFAVTGLSLILMLACFFVANSRYAVYEGSTAQDVAAPDVSMAKPIEQVAAIAASKVNAAADANANTSALPKSAAMTPPMPTPIAPTTADKLTPPTAPVETKAPVKPLKIKFEWVAWALRVSNFAAMLATTLYSLILIFCLKISLVGRLGGINHIARAFIWSLAAMALLMPWQKYFGGVLAGAVFTPADLMTACTRVAPRDVLENVFFYARFAGLPAVVMLMMLAAQVRSVRWAKATLRRLGVM